ncbi:breast cancer anti-estrogen resistance protein 1 isoform X1 [Kryptolebias marmoratus]|uniref:breast cancer anti-estrogen resistance protein 1 isoform X1 n=1 Tax=Kryptolebias marmoratus TaxID=37003 RepID=UPI0007F91D2B|nr:breast cancer anti-estrogen resistance protein 1 isoform X1 [Kryptolebias marmoratus]
MSVPVFCRLFDCLQGSPHVENILAKALYDNVAESPDELSFRKGDIMTVLERNTQGLDGWWLCSLHGRQGIVPGNRLKILVGMYDSKQQQPGTPSTQDAAATCPTPHVQRPLPAQSAYAKPTPAGSAGSTPSTGFANKSLPSVQYTSMHPAYSTPNAAKSSPAYSTPNAAKPSPDSVYMMPPSHGPKLSSQSLYQVPPGPSGLSVQAQPGPPSKAPILGQRQFQLPGQGNYQVPPSAGPGSGQAAASGGETAPGQDVYQVPPSLDKRNWESSNKPLGKVVVPTRVGQVYVYDTGKSDQDEYDVPPRHQPPAQQDIYDVPPTRQQYSTQVYDTPPMVVKGPSSGQDIYDTPASSDRNPQQTVYDFPPSVSKDVSDAHPVREETYDVPPHFAKLKSQPPVPSGHYLHNNVSDDDDEPPIPEDVYDVPPTILTDKHHLRDRGTVSQPPQEIYDIPAALRSGEIPVQDVYDFPREREDRGGERGDQYIYDVPPQVVRDAQSTSEELTVSYKRLSASSTGSSRSNHSTSSLDMVPVRDTPSFPVPGPSSGKPLILDLDQAMERLSHLQQAVESSVSFMMSFITGNWRSPAQLEGNLPAIHQAADLVRATVRDFLEFARGAVANAAQATDRLLQTKLGRQVGKMEEVFQSLIRHSQSLDSLSWSHTALSTPTPGGDDLDRLILTARGIPDDAKQLASFLHGNASLLFNRISRQQQQQLPLPPIPGEMTGSGSGTYQGGEKVHIQSRPLPSPPKFTAAEEEEGVERPYEATEEGWMEDYDYVHLQGKEEFEKNQRELLEKGNIIRHNKTQLEQQQIKQFEWLEQEVSRPISNDLTGWAPSPHHPLAKQSSKNSPGDPSSSKLCHGDRQLLLFYQEQCEQNITTVNNAIDAFFTAVNSNQPPKIFVAHSKFVILSAHKLVFIGDTLSRQAKCPEVRARVAQSSNTLCEKLKDIVISTKTAALQYPSPGAAREMTERVRELAGCTQQFRMVLGQLLLM